jgi:hypothetical protein
MLLGDGVKEAIVEAFPALAPHDVLRKWLYIDSRHHEFEATMQSVAEAIARNDRRFGVEPGARERKVSSPRSSEHRKRVH